jgi:thymidine phosphorylase
VAGIAVDEARARARVTEVLESGAALDRLRAVIARQGGDAAVIDDYSRFASTATYEEVLAPHAGFVVDIDAERIGRASMLLGAGRERLNTPIDYGAGILLQASVGEPVEAGQPLAQLRLGRHARPEDARALATSAFVVGDAAPPPRPLVYDVVG